MRAMSESIAIQLSHAELLLLLGLLGLPAPLALGPLPAAGHDAGVREQLAGALVGLVARELVQLDANPSQAPVPVAHLDAILRTIALPSSCLVVAERRGELRRAAHLSAHAGALVLHTSPMPRVHRLEPIADAAAAGAQLAAMLGAPSAPIGLALSLPAEALASSIDAAEAGEDAAAHALLCAAGVPGAEAVAFLAALGNAPARFAIGALRGLRGERPEALGALAIRGAHGAWWSPTGHSGGPLRLAPVAPHELRRELDALLGWMLCG